MTSLTQKPNSTSICQDVQLIEYAISNLPCMQLVRREQRKRFSNIATHMQYVEDIFVLLSVLLLSNQNPPYLINLSYFNLNIIA